MYRKSATRLQIFWDARRSAANGSRERERVVADESHAAALFQTHSSVVTPNRAETEGNSEILEFRTSIPPSDAVCALAPLRSLVRLVPRLGRLARQKQSRLREFCVCVCVCVCGSSVRGPDEELTFFFFWTLFSREREKNAVSSPDVLSSPLFGKKRHSCDTLCSLTRHSSRETPLERDSSRERLTLRSCELARGHAVGADDADDGHHLHDDLVRHRERRQSDPLHSTDSWRGNPFFEVSSLSRARSSRTEKARKLVHVTRIHSNDGSLRRDLFQLNPKGP